MDAGSNSYNWKTYRISDYKKSGQTETFTGLLLVNGQLDKYHVLHVTIQPDEEGRTTVKLTGKTASSYTIYTLGSKEEYEKGNGTDANGHRWTDLGLSVMWSPVGMGADKEGGLSNELYAYGYTQPVSGSKQPDYKDPGVEDISGDARYDAATARWGRSWHMPTIDEAQELSANCVHTSYISKKNEGGNSRWTGYWRLTSKRNGRSVIIPMGLQASGWSDFRVSGKINAPGNILNKRERLTATHTAVQIMEGMGGYKEVGYMLIPVRGEKSYRYTPAKRERYVSKKGMLCPSVSLTPPSPRSAAIEWYQSLVHPANLTNARLAEELKAINNYIATHPHAWEMIPIRQKFLNDELQARGEILDKYAWAQHALDQNGDKPIVEEPGVSMSEHAQRKDLVYARNEAKFCVKQDAYRSAMNSPIAPLSPWLAPESNSFSKSKGLDQGMKAEKKTSPQTTKKTSASTIRKAIGQAARKKISSILR